MQKDAKEEGEEKGSAEKATTGFISGRLKKYDRKPSRKEKIALICFLIAAVVVLEIVFLILG